MPMGFEKGKGGGEEVIFGYGKVEGGKYIIYCDCAYILEDRDLKWIEVYRN
jgi:hypothetical protein